MLKRLRVKLTLICTAITAVILAAMAVFALIIARDNQERNSIVAFRSDYNSIIYYIQNQTVIDHSWMTRTENGNGLILYFEDNHVPLQYSGSWGTATERGRLIGAAREESIRLGFDMDSPPSKSISADSLFYEIRGQENERYRAACATIPTRLGWVSMILLKDMRAEDATSRLQTRLFIAAVVVGTLLLAGFSWWFAEFAIRPVEESQRRQAQFVAAASHELRTPITVVQASASAILQATPGQAQKFARAIGKECLRMSRLVGDLLFLARADAKGWGIRKAAVDVETLLLSQYEMFEGVAAQKGVRLHISFDEETLLPKVSGDEERLAQILSILLDNAISYTPKGGIVSLSAGISGNVVRISVSDSGIGIPDEVKPHIFERFYRADTARSGKEHYGLGLSIAREIVALHRGKITVSDNIGGGSCFVVELAAE